MKDRITIAYDIAVLGGKDRSGVFRMTDEILDGLLKSERLNLALYTSLNNSRHCYGYFIGKYLNKTGNLANINYPILKMMLLKRHPSLKIRQVDELANIDVCLTPWYPIPAQIKYRNNIKKIHVVNDLIPLIMPETCEDSMPEHFRKFFNGLSKSDYYICISKNTKKDLLKCRKDFIPKNVSVMHLAADKGLFYPPQSLTEMKKIKNKYGIKGKKYFLSLSTLEPRKNFPFVVKSYISFLEKYNIKDTVLVITGARGWKYDKLFAGIDKYSKYKKNIIFTGFVDNEDMAGLYGGAEAFLFMSLYEGFGLPILEAMQCGTPVITSDNSSIPEVVGKAGIMISGNDESGLVGVLHRVYCNRPLKKDLSEKSIKQAEKFSWDRTMNKLFKIIEGTYE
jgi:glycosyltransferase involved in cell wall biosynthesis